MIEIKKHGKEKLRNISRESRANFINNFSKRCCSAKNILEIGTSNGYSTLWLANAVEETNGNVTTVELSSERVGGGTCQF